MQGSTRFKAMVLGLYALAFGILFGAWFWLVKEPAKDTAGGAQLTNWIMATLGALVGHILTLINSAAVPESTTTTIGDRSTTRTGPGASQAGFHLLPALGLLAFLALLFATLLSGCASLTDAGHTAYTFEPAVGADGKATGGCKFSATDGKEYSGRAISAVSTADGCQVMVQEGASTAFQGQAIAGKALSVLPSFAPILLPPGPAVVIPQTRSSSAPAGAGPKL